MVNENSTFGGFLTDIGEAKQANANALRIPWKITHMLLGDANGTDPVPAPDQTSLINQVYRAAINQLSVDPDNPGILIAELVLPPNVGGWWIRELGLEDEDGDFIAVANCAPSYKPLLAQGSGRNQVVRMHLILSNTANVELKIDPSVVLAYMSDSKWGKIEEIIDAVLDLPENRRAAYLEENVSDESIKKEVYEML
ncbi:MAG TPA: phage tail protein, partial [Wenzhouxiangella sp.]|nr:phage tail protein [Wenzhouxiangella sp.]